VHTNTVSGYSHYDAVSTRNDPRLVAEKLQGKRTLGRLRRKREDNIKIILCCESVKWIDQIFL
jgi:hypothetical protein